MYLEELTPEQEARLPEWADKWTNIGLSCEPLNRAAAEDAVNRAYRVAGLEPPARFIVCDSPLSGALTAAVLKDGDSVRDSVWDSVWDSVYGSHDAHWLGFYAFFLEVCELSCVEPLQPLIDLAKLCGWWIPCEHVCILQHRHCELHRDATGRLHNPDGPAVLYPDGWGIYAWHGVRLSPGNEWIIDEPDKITPEKILDETNAELRRVLLERYTPRRFVQEVNAEKIDENGDYVLYRAQFPGEPLAMLRCVDPSTSREYYLRVPPTMQSAWQAVSWTFGMDEAEYAPSLES